MFAIIGILAVLGSVIGGFLMEKGNLRVLMQPSELVIIGGAAIGTLLAANPVAVLIKIGQGILRCLSGSPYTKAYYLDGLKMLNDIFQFARKSGMAKLEEDVENPDKSPTFSRYPKFLKDHHLLHFICGEAPRVEIGATAGNCVTHRSVASSLMGGRSRLIEKRNVEKMI